MKTCAPSAAKRVTPTVGTVRVAHNPDGSRENDTGQPDAEVETGCD
jgi:hypothetical protein